MKNKSIPRIIRYYDRDIIIVRLPDNTKQPFYRSTGRNSGRPGVWFPFDGWKSNKLNGWFIKDKYCVPGIIHRYGTKQLKDISDYLATLNIPEGKVTEDGQEINNYIKTARCFTRYSLRRESEDANR